MTRTLRLLLGELIDYAGLFPPAALPMQEAVRNYAQYINGECGWMLGRFITPVARLDEFERAALEYTQPHTGSSRAWRVSVLGGNDPASDLKAIQEFNQRRAGSIQIDTLETKASTADEIEAFACAGYAKLAVYIEIPIAEDPHPLIAAIARAGARAKARTGGITPEAFPSSENVVRFLAACASSRVAFKATAGLHHPVRSVNRLTYEPDSASSLMHGFLNVFLAAAWIRAGMNASDAVELLEEKDTAAFRFGDAAVEWRNHRLTTEEIAAARTRFASAFGSCSFTEPVEDLRALGLEDR
ncbi:MAG: hypothetical protein KF868_14090 [Acidobacteria bacterium]|nr:hypothetical protein [Acidobacteriota bacterium]MCW5970478.1 hypothetical protein [Blastocatellales bacterium]